MHEKTSIRVVGTTRQSADSRRLPGALETVGAPETVDASETVGASVTTVSDKNANRE
jgi:hypothetical protein